MTPILRLILLLMVAASALFLVSCLGLLTMILIGLVSLSWDFVFAAALGSVVSFGALALAVYGYHRL